MWYDPSLLQAVFCFLASFGRYLDFFAPGAFGAFPSSRTRNQRPFAISFSSFSFALRVLESLP